MRGFLAIASLALVWVGCGDDDRPMTDAAGDVMSGSDVRPDTPAELQCRVALPVDILWVIDNSHSMAEEQSNLGMQFSALIDELTMPPDVNGDGMADYLPAQDIQMAIVTTDMGVGEIPMDRMVTGCDERGDEGAFVLEPCNGRPDDRCVVDADCQDVQLDADKPYLSYRVGVDDPEQLAHDFACLAKLGTNGCGYEQQLESMLAALQKASSGQPSHQGFLRGDSLIAVIFVTDEDDCSVSDSVIFDPSAAGNFTYGPAPSRCWDRDNSFALHPTSRYTDFLRGLRLDRRGDVVVAAITGVPGDLVRNRDVTMIDYRMLLDDPRMMYRPSDEDPDFLAPACSFSGVGEAIPSRRFVGLIQDFARDGEGIVQSICSTDFTPAIRAIARLIGGRLCPPLI